MNIGIVLLGLGFNAGPVGGAERFFADFIDVYNDQKKPKNKLFLITDRSSLEVLKKLNKIKYPDRIIVLKNVNNRFKDKIEGIDFIFKCVYNNIKIVHVASYGRHYFSRLKFLEKSPMSIRPKIILNIVDAELSYTLANKIMPRYDDYVKKYNPLFDHISISGVYSWYEHFKEQAEKNGWIKSKPIIETIKTRFSTISNRLGSSKQKKNQFVYASRLIERKRPLLFIAAIYLLKKSIPDDLFKLWQFKMFGGGPLLSEIQKKIQEYDLNDHIFLGVTNDMAEVLVESKCFVSTMDLENFPSQAINEAMAAGNAIIARNVGQTSYFVNHMKNGLLLNSDSAEELAEALKYYINHPESHEPMAKESIRLTREVHTPENFIKDIDKFWSRFE